MEDGIKKCKKCGEEKFEEEFHFRYKSAGERKSQCRECVNEDQRKRREVSGYLEKWRDYQRERYANDPEYRERQKEKVSIKRANDPDYFNNYMQERYANDPEYREQKRQISKQWREANPDKMRLHAQKRRDWLNDTSDGYTTEDIKRLREQQSNECYYCGVKMNDINYDPAQWTIEHKIPRTKGGTNTLDNIVIACSKCNHRKKNKDFADFIEEL